MRRRLAFAALLLAWLCANGAIWNVVQVVAWGKMLNDYSQLMPMAQAIRVTFNGTAPCNLCVATEHARQAAREQLPREPVVGTADKLLLAFEPAAPVVLTPPDPAWPGTGNIAGLRRTDPVPLPPPRV